MHDRYCGTFQTTENILRTRECVLNLPSVDQAEAVDKLALLTGSNPVPAGKIAKGYVHEPDKFSRAKLTPAESEIVKAPRVLECPVHLEAQFVAIHPFAAETGIENIRSVTMELKIVRVHLDDSILSDQNRDHVDPEKWKPLIMSFQQFYGLGSRYILQNSHLSLRNCTGRRILSPRIILLTVPAKFFRRSLTV